MKANVARCPDCNAVFHRGRLDHAESCPLVAEFDRASDDDRAYFQRNPYETERERPATLAEQQVSELSFGWRPRVVVVRNLAPGRRLRHFIEGVVL